jgi:hypothetical protein
MSHPRISKTEHLPTILAALRQAGRPLSVAELSAATSLCFLTVGGATEQCTGSLRRYRADGCRWIVEPRHHLAQHWPEWADWLAGKGVAA